MRAGLAKPAAIATAFACSVASLALWIALFSDDFSLAFVAQSSAVSLPLLYKATAFWGGHEGSMLLWLLVLAGWTSLLAVSNQGKTKAGQCAVAVMLLLFAALAAFTAFTSNPFWRLLPLPPEDGADLNPLLQDPAMAVHPPLLYLGFVGSATPFAIAAGHLIAGEPMAKMAQAMRPWTLASWAFFNCRHSAWLLVGLLRTRLGRLVVLGSGRKLLPFALANCGGGGSLPVDHR